MKCISTPLRFLAVVPSELSLATVLKSGQSFRWNKFDTILATGVKGEMGEEFAMGHEDRTIVLRQTELGIYYRSLFNYSPPNTAFLNDVEHDTTQKFIQSYFQLSTSLVPLYKAWSETDSHFKKKIESCGSRLEGIRVLNQPSFETLMSFICSSNNNIARIGQMVTKLCIALGSELPHPSSFSESSVHTKESLAALPCKTTATPTLLHLHSFPAPTSLILDSTTDLLRELGFGYRAPFVHSSSILLLSLARDRGITPEAYLESLRSGNLEGGLEKAREKLLEFKGVGRKVADCVALFGLGYNEVVPVDTHVFQIAIRDYAFPASKTTALTLQHHNRVAARLSDLWGSHSGWAQQVLFFADLKTASTSPKKKGVKLDAAIIVKAKWEEELEELLTTPGKKRSRTSVVVVKTEVKKEEEDYPTPIKTPKKRKIKVEELSPSKV